MRTIVVSFALAMGSFVLAHFLDRWQLTVSQEADRTFNYWPKALGMGLAPVVVAVLLALIAWVCLAKKKPTIASATILFILGLAGAFSAPLWLLFSRRDMPFSVAPMLVENSRIAQVGAGLTVVGAIGFWRSLFASKAKKAAIGFLEE